MAQRRPSLRRGAQGAGARSAGGRRERVHPCAGARRGRAARARGPQAGQSDPGRRRAGRKEGGLAMAPAWGGAGQGMGRRWRRPHSCGRGPELGRRRPHSRMGRSAAGPRLSDGVGGWGVWGGYGQGGGGGTRLRRQGGRPASGGGRRHRPKPSHREPRPAAICNKGPETKACAAVPVRWAALRVKQIIIAHFYIIVTHYSNIFTAIITCCSSLLRKNRTIIAYYYCCFYVIFTYYYICYYVIITCCSCNNEPIITVIMGPLLPIFTRSLMGNNGFIFTHYVPGQLADESRYALLTHWNCPAGPGRHWPRPQRGTGRLAGPAAGNHDTMPSSSDHWHDHRTMPGRSSSV